MAPYNTSYGAVHELQHSTALLEQAQSQGNSTADSGHHCRRIPAEQSPSTWSLSRRRNWLATAVFCGLGVGTIMATGRPAATSTTDNSSSAPQAEVTRGSLLAGRLPTSVKQSAAEERGGDILRAGPTVSDHQNNSHSHRHSDLGVTDAGSKKLDYTMTNFYHTRDGKPGSQIPWLKDVKLAEPYRDTTLTVREPRDGHSYHWEIINPAVEEEDKGVMFRAEGAVVTAMFTVLDVNKVVLREVEEESGTIVRKLEETVMVKYVRREIRTLVDEEREELLDSMLQLWKVRAQDGDGKELYGEDYADIWAINRLHFKAASPFECDHFHDGLGFLTSHTLLTNTFEYSLQRVNPKLTVPYWDFTIEKSKYGGDTRQNAENQASSPLLSMDWFGSQDTDDGMVKDGRWAYTEIPRLNHNNPGELEADVYSKLRAPWNVNDRPYLSRGLGNMCGARVQSYYPWPTCEMHYNLNRDYNDFYSWVWASLYDPHGPVHVWLGGVLDCEDTYRKLADLVGVDIATTLSYYSFIHRKNLFRDGYWTCEGTTTVDTQPEEVMQSQQCGCLGYNLESGDDYLTISGAMVMVDDLTGDFDAHTQRQVVATLCNGIMNDGDHLQASSSLDPSFWVTHPTMERLWMFKRLTGTMTDLTWPDTDISYTSDDGMITTESISLSGDTCNGHRGSDVFPFGFGADEGSADFTTRTGIKDDTDNENKISNRQVLQMLDPRQNGLDYIYDTFEWKHCAADGYDFNDVWESRSSETVARTTFKKGEPRYPQYGNLVKDMNKRSSRTFS